MTGTQQANRWNVLTGNWLEVMDADARLRRLSPLDALRTASRLRCIVSGSPLDLFAAHRFLLTLLYWKADACGGVDALRRHLLSGSVPRRCIDALAAEERRFHLFGSQAPFMQDVALMKLSLGRWKSAGSFFAEFAVGTNIAHFHHGDDDAMRLCIRCATVGMLRLVPWSQSGGQGLTPSVHGAPPIMVLARGVTLARTLGLNLVALDGRRGRIHWHGSFSPSSTTGNIPYLEALTWNPRRVYLKIVNSGMCWRCGADDEAVVGRIVYAKNEATKKPDKKPWPWRDPAGFYVDDPPYTPAKSRTEREAAEQRDLAVLVRNEPAPESLVVRANEHHSDWLLVVPCTNPAHNKSFDHRVVALAKIDDEHLTALLPPPGPIQAVRVDGWRVPDLARATPGAWQFVNRAIRVLSAQDWADLGGAAMRRMHEAPAAFDILTGLLWSLRKKVRRLPSRKVAWLTLKLMASVPSRLRIPARRGLQPLEELPRQQIAPPRGWRAGIAAYPRSLPSGNRLETALREILRRNMQSHSPRPIHWVELCAALDELVP